MNLRTRFVIIIAGFILLLTSLAVMISTRVLLKGSLALEKEIVREAVDGGRQYLIEEGHELSRMAVDWSCWDDTYAFMANTNPAYIDGNLLNASLRNLRLNMIAYVGTDGQAVYGKGYDIERDAAFTPDEKLWRALLTSDRLLRHETLESSVSGLLLVGHDIWLVASGPILTSLDKGPSRGTLIMGRRMNNLVDWSPARPWNGLFSLRPVGTESLPERVAIEAVSMGMIKGKAFIRDINDNPSILIETTMARRIFSHGIAGQFFLTGWILLSGAATGLFVFWLVDRWVLRELTEALEALKKGMAAVAAGANPKLHLKTTRRDEMGDLANSLNDMLTALDKAQQASENSRRELIQAQKMTALGTLVAGVAHEINNPNTVINLNLPALRRRLDKLVESLSRPGDGTKTLCTEARRLKADIDALLTETQDASVRIAVLVSSLKAFARPASEKMNALVEVNSLIRNAGALMKHQLEKKGIRVDLSLDQQSTWVKGNEQQLTQVLINLIGNACEASPCTDSSIQLATAVDAVSHRVRITVLDQGTGIAPEIMDRIFEPFFTTRRERGGTGLGLSISAEIVRSHGGTIHVQSPPEQGARFIVELPTTEQGAP
ncbi:MAG: CHASE4 domain-containing protein [Kiritimatiellia bacterium]